MERLKKNRNWDKFTVLGRQRLWFRYEDTVYNSNHAVGCSSQRTRMSILVTDVASYIGFRTCVELLQTGHEVVVFNNFSNSAPETLKPIEQIRGWKPSLVQGIFTTNRPSNQLYGNASASPSSISLA